jgi:hypothetical protein
MVILYQHFGTICWSHLQGSSWNSWPLKMGLIGCPETSVQNYHSTLHNIPDLIYIAAIILSVVSLSQGNKVVWEQKDEEKFWIETGGRSEPRYRSRYSDSLRDGRSWDRIQVGGKIFRTRQNRPWGPHSLLYNGYWVSFPEVKRPPHGVDHPPHLAPKLKSRAIPLHPLWAFMVCYRVNFNGRKQKAAG